ncbi:ferredoxin [Kitasatospora sp. NPDC059747]|uniref:ferredoxin n=1 Tax=Kitasatospora sp. NPDC059747 TaxID=3346930 RepID=UPI0036678330
MTWRAFERELAEAKRRFDTDLLRFPVDGPWDEVAYWDPVPAVRVFGGLGDGRWEDRSRLAVPGPVYAGETDTGLNGPYYLPAAVLSGEDGCEFVHRQPVNLREVAALAEVAACEPQGGYASDGDHHWTPESVRAWWRERGAVREWIAAELALGDAGQNEEAALRAYAEHLDGGGLEAYLRGYVYWLAEGREPLLGRPLPVL